MLPPLFRRKGGPPKYGAPSAGRKKFTRAPKHTKGGIVMALTVGELKQHLAGFEDDREIFFGSEENVLTFNRLKQRGKKLLQVEFIQDIYRDQTGKIVFSDHSARSNRQK
jgi:hypothetical protein